MKNFNKCKVIWDKKFVLAFLITLICAIICGIVLYKPVKSSIYLKDLAENYVYNVFNFKNSQLLLTHILTDVTYLYLILLISYFLKFKYLTLILVFLRGLFLGVYTAILGGLNSFGGIIVAIFVFVPSTLLFLVSCCIVAEFCNKFYKTYAICMPVVLAVIDCIIYAILINVLFRIVIIIV